ncbi:MAG: site-2 protease family protein [Planctomycetota bacterium]
MDAHDLQKLVFFRIPVARVAGIRVTLHWTLLIAIIAALLLHYAHPRYGLVFVIVVLGSIFLHEMGHCFGARRVGGRAEEVILWPLGGLAPVQVPVRPWPIFLTTVLGPLANVVLAVAGLIALLGLGGSPAWMFEAPEGGFFAQPFAAQAAFALFAVNAVLALLNLVPAFPLDGGRIFHAALWPRFGFERALRLTIRLAFVAAVAMVAIGLWLHDPMLAAMGGFVAVGALHERRALALGQGMASEAPPWAESLPFYDPDAEEPRPGIISRWREERRRRREAEDARRREDLRARLDVILTKVSEVGMDGLSAEERRFLEHASAELRKEQSR